MPTYTPRRAQRFQLKLRMAITGPSKSGKTFNSLQFAGTLGGRICVIDTDQGNAEKYVGLPHIPDFDVIVLDTYTPEDHIAAIKAAWDYDVLVIDSASKEWLTTLEIVDQTTLASPSQNAFTVGWPVANPRHNRFVETMLAFPGHLIVTVREKVKHALVKNDHGKLEPRKLGLRPIQRPDDFEFNFDIACAFSITNVMTVEARSGIGPELHGTVIRKPGPEFMDPIKHWLGIGHLFPIYTFDQLKALVKSTGAGEAELRARMAELVPGITRFPDLTARDISLLYESFLPPPETLLDPTEPAGITTSTNPDSNGTEMGDLT